jgi:hypothetical protein
MNQDVDFKEVKIIWLHHASDIVHDGADALVLGLQQAEGGELLLFQHQYFQTLRAAPKTWSYP